MIIPNVADHLEREPFERRVQDYLDAERAKREAHRRLDAEERGPVVPPTLNTLRSRLARPRSATAFRIDACLPSNGRAIFSAPAKAGKTTVVGNLVRSLADGDAFLGQYRVTPNRRPILPFLHVGLVPLLQMVVLPPVVFWMAERRALVKGSYGSALGVSCASAPPV